MTHFRILPLFSTLAILSSTAAFAQDCNDPDSASLPACSSVPTGFSITIDDKPLVADKKVLKLDRRDAAGKSVRHSRLPNANDVALAAAEVQVRFDGLDLRPRLDAGIVSGGIKDGSVRIQNRMNYPAFVTRGELRIVDQSARGGPRVVSVVSMNPNSEATVTLPNAGDLTYVYRVYDSRGRYDETAPASLTTIVRRDATLDVEEGTTSASRRRIPIYGGAVTVTGRNIRSSVRTLGETVRADGQGNFVLQRILPVGDHDVAVDVAGGPKLERGISIPKTDLFYVGLVDVTVGKTLSDDLADPDADDTFNRGRVAGFVNGKISGGFTLTASIDTGEDELGNLLKNLDKKDPRSFLDRMDDSDFYPVYGDDSTSEDLTPTSGKFYVKLERDESYVMWGDFKSQISDTEYLRNERKLYGAQAVYRSAEQTGKGESRFALQVHAAQPDSLPQRDIFLGTGGSAYFLNYQDISVGSETLFIEVRDRTTGRVIERKALTFGIDYDINYVQGLIVLSQPLSSSAAGGGLINDNPNGDNQAFLVANYEHSSTTLNPDTFSYGARGHYWVNDNLRVGATYLNENLGFGRQEGYGVDVLYHVSERTFAEFEYAQTNGVGQTELISVDGGLTGTEVLGASGNGRAFRFKGQVDLQDIGFQVDGVIGGYFEDRTAGFSSLNYQVENDERLWGIHADITLSDTLSARLYYNDFEDATGVVRRDGGLELAYQQTSDLLWEFGVEMVERRDPTTTTDVGKRVDAAVRVTYEVNKDQTVYAFAQGTLNRSGSLRKNNRYGFGAELQVNERWKLTGEISDGTTGVGGRFLATYQPSPGNSYYFGYTLDPSRGFADTSLSGDDQGTFVIGSRRKVHDDLTLFAENTYDLFGVKKSLTSTYGVEYSHTQFLSFTGGLEIGQVDDPVGNTAFDRTALSFGVSYRDEDLSARARLEYRKDRGINAGAASDVDAWAMTSSLRYKISDSSRLLASFEGVYSKNADPSIANAKFAEATFGYAYRPVDNDRLNLLAKYTFLYDMTDRRNGVTVDNQPRQVAHVFSLDASYDLNERWTLGGKVGYRMSKQDTGAGFVSNNASLGVLNLRYHMPHKWDALVEVRALNAQDIGTDYGFVGAIYKHIGDNVKIGVGYNAGRFSSDLTDVTYDDKGVFLNMVVKF